MAENAGATPANKILVPYWRAFLVYYVAIVIFFLGPRFNPEVRLFGLLHFTVGLGTILGLGLIVLVLYLKLGREYRITAKGLAVVWRWPWPRQQEIAWENLGEIEVRRGMVQSMLWVGNLLFRDKSGGPDMFWSGLPNPKELQAEIEGRRP